MRCAAIRKLARTDRHLETSELGCQFIEIAHGQGRDGLLQLGEASGKTRPHRSLVFHVMYCIRYATGVTISATHRNIATPQGHRPHRTLSFAHPLRTVRTAGRHRVVVGQDFTQRQRAMSEEALRMAAARASVYARRAIGLAAGGGLAFGLAGAMTTTLMYATALSPVMSHSGEASILRGFDEATAGKYAQAAGEEAQQAHVEAATVRAVVIVW